MRKLGRARQDLRANRVSTVREKKDVEKKTRIKLLPAVRSVLLSEPNRRQYILFVLAAVLIKIFLVGFQMIQIYPAAAPIDDELMFAAANSIKNGEWLGAYSWCAMAKHMFFAVWLWLLNLLHIPYLIGGQLLYLAACVVMTNALSPKLKNRLYRFAAFLLLWFSPYSVATFTTRVYIDNIYPSLCLLFFAGVIGVCLRIESSVKSTMPYSVAAGLGLGLSWITKDDAVWILPFGVCATLIYFIFAVCKKEGGRKALARVAVPLIGVAVFFVCTSAYKAMNYKYYGRFIISDYTSAEFKEAVALIVRADTDVPHKHVLVCDETLEKLYASSPSFAKLQPYLDSAEYRSDYAVGTKNGDFNSAGIIWAVRRAAFDSGEADTALKAQEFYKRVTLELTLAKERGELELTSGNPFSGLSATLMPYDNSYLGDTLKEVFNSLKTLVLFEQTSSLAELSYATPEQAGVYSSFTYTRASYSAKAGTSEADYYPWHIAAEVAFVLITWLYRILVWFLALFGFKRLFGDIKATVAELKKKLFTSGGMLTVVILGVLLSALLRIVMISYIEVTSFCIGTYLLYLAPAGAVSLVFLVYTSEPFLEWLTKLTKSDKA